MDYLRMNLSDVTFYNLLHPKGVEDTIDRYPFMESLVPNIILISGYLYVVLKWGPQYMESRKPYNLKSIIATYNIFQVLACSYLVYNFIGVGFRFSFIGNCHAKRQVSEYENGMDAVKYGWISLCVRIAEFSETVFFVLRKKQSQVSFLHVYHHIATYLIIWYSLKYSLSYHEMSLMVLNCCVHIIMYSYYFLSMYKIFAPLTNRVKPLITIIQLVQLATMLVHVYVALKPSCDAHKGIYIGHAVNLVILISLFSNFYIQTYTRRGAIKIKKQS